MNGKRFIVIGVLLGGLGLVPSVSAQDCSGPCPDGTSYCEIVVSGKDRITIAPDGAGERWDEAGITIEVFLQCNGVPMTAIPREEIILFSNGLCIDPNGNIADAATDENGRTTFSGSLRAGGCVESLDIFACGTLVCSTSLKTNSPDIGAATNCFVDSSDFVLFAENFGTSGSYDVCLDYNESGPPTIETADFARFGFHFGSNSQSP